MSNSVLSIAQLKNLGVIHEPLVWPPTFSLSKNLVNSTSRPLSSGFLLQLLSQPPSSLTGFIARASWLVSLLLTLSHDGLFSTQQPGRCCWKVIRRCVPWALHPLMAAHLIRVKSRVLMWCEAQHDCSLRLAQGSILYQLGPPGSFTSLLVALMFLQHTRHIFSSEPLCSWLPLPGIPCSQIPVWLLHSLSSGSLMPSQQGLPWLPFLEHQLWNTPPHSNPLPWPTFS